MYQVRPAQLVVLVVMAALIADVLPAVSPALAGGSASYESTSMILGTGSVEVDLSSITASSDPTDLSAEIAFRATYGLTTDPAFVTSVERSPSSLRDYGVALTPTEEADLKHRDEVDSKLDPLLKHLASQAQFGGLYIDQSSGGVIDIATTGDASATLKDATSSAPSGAVLRSRHVQYTLQQLSALKDRVTQDVSSLTAAGVEVATIGVDVVANRVRIEVANLTDQVTTDLNARYGAEVIVVPGDAPVPATCTSRGACPLPNKGGLSIHATVGTTTYYCSSSYSARDIIYGAKYLYTAGHCIKDAGINTVWYMGSTAIGPGSVQDFYNGTSADVGLIALYSSNLTPPLNQVYASSNLDVRSMSGWWASSSQQAGVTVCRSGLTSGWLCGTIVQPDVTAIVGGTTVLHQWKTSYASGQGDSGATMMDNSVNYMGVMSSFTASNTWYGTVDYGDIMPFGTSRPLNPCVSSSCP